MTTPAKQAEADRIELLYHYALVQIGVSTIEEALELWEDVPATEAAATASGWLADAVDMILRRRRIARSLALSYYRLVRALRTGSTIPLPDEDDPPETVTIADLKREFDRLVDSVAPEDPSTGAQSASQDDTGPEVQEQNNAAQIALEAVQEAAVEGDADAPLRNDTVPVDEIEADLLKILRLENDDLAAEEAVNLLDSLGVENLLGKLEAIDNSQPAEVVDIQRNQAKRKAGARQAAVAERISMNAARGLVYDLGQFDGKVLGWIRFSQTGTPCGFCAMLLSRGFTEKSGLYTTRRAAQSQGNKQDEDKYHDNCHCVAVPVFLREQLNSPLFSLNRQYAEEWPRVTRGFGGEEALAVWRKHIRAQQQETKAQAAA